MGKIMIALGGNALGTSPEEQKQLVRKAAKPIVDLIRQGHEVVIAHGNGPQVGMIHSAIQLAEKCSPLIPHVTLNECVAMSQAYIGYHLQNAIREELLACRIHKNVVSIVTQVVVSEDDPAFRNPDKPIGQFYSRDEAAERFEAENIPYTEDSGRGYRQVVASPSPVRIVEAEIAKQLVAGHNVVITVGGGGIPVFEKGNALVPAQAVIDKDAASRKMAEELDFDFLFILTAVDQVAINYGKPDQVNLGYVSVEEARNWMAEKQFAPGSMLPKVEAAIKFVQSRAHRIAVITSLEKAGEAIKGNTGTIVYNGSRPDLS